MFKKSLLLMLLMAFMAPWAAKAQSTLTVYENASDYGYEVPLYGYYGDYFQKTEFVIPAEQLSTMENGTISQMTFYLYDHYSYHYPTEIFDGTFQVFLKEVDNATLSAWSGTEGSTTVYSSTLDGTSGTMTVSFTSNYTYEGGNLLVGVYEITKGHNYPRAYFVGQTVTGASGNGTSSSSLNECDFEQKNFIPKTTFTYTPGAAPTCPKPTDFAATPSSIYSNQATLTWTAGALGQTDFDIVVSPTELSDPSEGTIVELRNLTTLSYTTPATLTAHHTYYAYVRAYCSPTDQSRWVNTTFTTACGAVSITPVAFEYGFENADDFECWTKENFHSSTGIVSSNAHAGSSYSFQFYQSSSNTIQTLITPQLITTDKGVRVAFYYKQGSSGSNYIQKFKVGYSTNGTDYIWDDIITTSNTNYNLYQHDFTASGIQYIAIQWIRNTENGAGWGNLYIDDITLSEAPSCFQPTDLEASVVTSSSATLSWTPGSANQNHWDIYYSTSATAPEPNQTPSVSNTGTNPYYTIESLTENTPYYAWVRGNCGNDDVSEWSEVVSFTTLCNAFPIPYEYGFEDEADMGCWTVRNTSPSTTITNSGHESDHSFYFYYGSSYATQYLITPELSGTSTGLNVAFYYKRTYSTATLQVGYSTTTKETSAFDGHWTSIENYSTSYQLYETVFPENTKYVAFKYNSTSYDYIYIDDISFTIPNPCAKPTGLTAVANTLSSDGITLTWTAGGSEEEWTLQYATNNTFTEGVVTIGDITTNSQELDNLTANTPYYARVKANCSETSASDWCNDIYSFRTDCGTIAIDDYSYGFEEENEMYCWTMENCYSSTEGASTGRYNSNGYDNSSYSFRFVNSSGYNAQRLISPEISNATTGVHVEFYYKKGYDYTEQFKVGYSANGTDFIFGDEVTDVTTTYQKYENNFPAGTKYIAIQYATASYYLYIDNISLTTPPTCWKPTGLQVVANSVTAHAATLSWTAGNEETNWILQYSTDQNFSGTPAEIQVATTPTKQITGLDGETTYYVRVKADCGDGDESDWSSVVSFTTGVACVAPTNLGASARTAHTANVYWTADEGQNEWEIAYSTTSNFDPNATGVTHVTEISGNHSSENPYILSGIPGTGYYYLRVRSNCGTTDGYSAWSSQTSFYNSYTGKAEPSNFAVSDITTSSAVLTWTGAATNDNHESYEVCFSTTNSVPTLVENTNYFTGISETTYTLEDLNDGTQYYAWVRDNCGTDGYSEWSTSNINFTTLELCPTPTNLHMASYTTTTATLEWTAATGQDAWLLYYSTNDEEPDDELISGENIVSVNTNSTTTLNNLTAETQYYAWVRGNCTASSNGYSAWSQVCDFMPSAALALNLYSDGTTTNTRIPFNASNVSANAGIESQFIIPATDMGNAIKGGSIQKLTFYSNYGNDASFGSATFNVKISEVDDSYFKTSDLVSINSAANYSGSFSYSNGKLTINLTTPYVYQGGNLIVDIRLTNRGTNADISWIGNSTTNNQSLYKPYSGNNSRYQFVPKTTITYTPAVAFTTAGNWNVAGNWSTGAIPGTTDNVVINAAAIIPSDYTAQINNVVIGTGSLTIEDGGQLICNNAPVVTAQKSITAWDPESSTADGWYFIALPVDATDYNPASAGLITDDLLGEQGTRTYDFYYLDYAASKWMNYRSAQFTMTNGKGYLYANASLTTLEFTGAIKPYDATYTVGDEGWNLVGNPYTFKAYVNQSHYTLNSDRNAIVAATSASAAIDPCTGVIVNGVATFSNEQATTQSNSNGYIQLALTQQVTRGTATTLDNAIVSFNEGEQLGKFYFAQQNANLYIPQGAEEYAIAYSNGQGEMPVNFKANENGQYTITVNAENVEMNYLHLIDNMTGADIDLLQTPSYTFNATVTDYESRFRLVFVANSFFGNENGNVETFAFCSNGNWIIANEGQATLQVVDLNGRILSSETVNGSVSKSINAPAGMYLLRLINGENVKVQKIVVR